MICSKAFFSVNGGGSIISPIAMSTFLNSSFDDLWWRLREIPHILTLPLELLEYSRNRMYRNLVSFPVNFLHGRVVGVFMTHKESSLDVTTVRVLPLAVEHLFVEFDVVIVDGVIKGDSNHLGHVLVGQVAGDGRAVLRAEAVRQHTDGRVTGWCTVRVIVVICKPTSLYV